MEKRDYKCGWNWIPDWVFNETRFNRCCALHDGAYSNQVGKWKADIAFLRCTWQKAKTEESFLWRLRDKAQSILLFLIVIVLPFSYITYFACKVKKSWQSK